jgi:SAM-dependent methyltransferase
MTVSHPIPLADASPPRITRILQDAGFSFDAVKARLGTEYRQWPPEGAGVAGKFLAFLQAASMHADIGTGMLSPAKLGTIGTISSYFKNRGPKNQLDLLIWLFLFNEPVEAKALTGIFSAKDLNALAAMNLIRLDAGAAICDLALFECAGLFVATDAWVKRPDDANCVMALIPESFDFVGAVSRKPVNSALDLCTGSGVHALVAARHSKHVVATDINPRALRFAEFNAWFNGITNIEFCQSDLFRALEGRAFDLILANPPYIPDTASSPNDNFYCGGKSGDVLWSQILQGLEKHLRPGGLCQIIHMIILFDNESYEDRIRALLGPLADFCNVLICSNAIAFRNRETAAATSVHFGVTSIKRYVKPGGMFYVRAPFRPPLPFDVSDLLLALEQTSRPEERTLVCKRHYAQSRRNRISGGTGRVIRTVSFMVCCALVLSNALFVFRGMWKRRRRPVP